MLFSLDFFISKSSLCIESHQRLRHYRIVHISVKVPGNPIKLSSVANEEYSSPPLLGEHTKEVLQKWLNYSDEKLSKLHENEIIELKR